MTMSKGTKWIKKGLVVLSVLSLFFTYGCGQSNAPSGSGASSGSGSAGKEPIKIGWLGPMTGTYASLGDWDTKGAQLAFDQVNAQSGINGRQIQLIKYDDQGDPSKSVTLAQKLTSQDKVVAAFATCLSTSALADVPVFQKAQVPQLTAGMALDLTNKGSDYVFRYCPPSPPSDKTIVNYMVKQGYKTYAIIADNGDYGKGETTYMTAALKDNGITPLDSEFYGPNDKDFTGQLNKIIQANPQVLLLGGSEVASGLVAKQARQLGFKGQLAGGNAMGTPLYISTAGADIANGTYFAANYITNDANDATKAFAKAYQDKYGEAPEGHGAKAYDGANVLIQALKNCGTNITGAEVAKQLHAVKGFKVLQGTMDVQANGETLTQTLLGVVKNGKLTQLPQ